VSFRSRYESFDRLQQRHRLLGFLLAVRQKCGGDQGGYLAATIAYYGFFATFPLLLVFTALGFALQGHHDLQQSILNSALGQFPVIGRDLKSGALKGNAVALGVGIAAALLVGLGCLSGRRKCDERSLGACRLGGGPTFSRPRACAHTSLAVGGGALLATALGGLGTIGAHLGIGWKAASVALSVALN
jgi:membrane protein